MPKSPLDSYQTVLITGASSGIGEEFAMQLAASSKQMILVSRRLDEMERVRDALLKIHPNLHVFLEVRDLSRAGHRSSLVDYLSDNQIEVDLLINNAGLGDYGEVASGDWDKVRLMMEVNMSALTHLTMLMLPMLKARKKAGIINVSSLASVLPIPDFSIYAATKAYVTSFTESLRIELLNDNVNATALCPGPVHTNFGKVSARSGMNKGFGAREWFYVDKAHVVRAALEGVVKNTPLVFPSIKVKVIAWFLAYLWRPLLRLALRTRPRRPEVLAKANASTSSAPQLILASGSPRRKKLLSELGYSFEVITSDVHEVHDEEMPLVELCEINAGLKAREVSLAHPEALVIGSDTLVYHQNTPLGKPKDLEEAAETLKRLSGDTHQVCSAVSVMKNGEAVSRFHDVTEVQFKELTNEVIQDYLFKVNVLDKAGSYAIQEHGELIVESYQGDFNNVMGLPQKLVDANLQTLGVHKSS